MFLLMFSVNNATIIVHKLTKRESTACERVIRFAKSIGSGTSEMHSRKAIIFTQCVVLGCLAYVYRIHIS